MNINELIEFNLNRINNDEDVRKLELKGLDNKTLSNLNCLTLFDRLISESLIDTDRFERIYLLSRAYDIINYGGWNKYIKDSEEEKKELNNKNNLKEKLEIDLANSNLQANELNRKIAKQNKENEKKNRVSTWVNIIIGLLNFLAIVWQIIKSAR